MKLYEINEAIENCIANITDPETGEIIGEQADFDLLDNLQMERVGKIEQIALWVKNLNADAAALKAEKDAFAAREKAAKNKAESLKQYLSYALCGEPFKTDRCAVSFRKSEQIKIDEGAEIPEEYLKYKEPDVDKTALKKAVKNGLAVKGVEIVEKQNLQIK